MSSVPELDWIVIRLGVAFIVLTGGSWVGIWVHRRRRKQFAQREKLLDEQREQTLAEMGFR